MANAYRIDESYARDMQRSIETIVRSKRPHDEDLVQKILDIAIPMTLQGSALGLMEIVST